MTLHEVIETLSSGKLASTINSMLLRHDVERLLSSPENNRGSECEVRFFRTTDLTKLENLDVPREPSNQIAAMRLKLEAVSLYGEF